MLKTIIIFPIWLTLVLLFRQHRQWLFYYLIAAFGLTIMIVLLAEYFGFDQTLVNMASFHVELISKNLFKFQTELLSSGRFQLIRPVGGSDILKLGIECSAILESSIAFALIIFYPLFDWKQKILRSVFALVVTYVINILRLMIIVIIAYRFGSNYIFLAHAGVARIFFFICELLLYWYIITKTTVKSVGDSIENDVPINKTAQPGRSLQLRHAYTQIAVIVVVVLAGVYSFIASKDWQKAFAPVARVNRPIIYKDETGIETPTPLPSNQNQGDILGEKAPIILDQFVIERLRAWKAIDFGFMAGSTTKINLQIIHGDQPIRIELYKNGILQKFTSLSTSSESELINNQNVFEKPLKVQPDDIITIRYKNLSGHRANYTINIIEDKTNE